MYAHRMVRDLFNHTEESLAELDRDAEKLRRCLKSLYESTWSGTPAPAQKVDIILQSTTW